MGASLKIEKVVKVVDTRQYEEQGDRWVPIAGSGEESTCARCGKPHEVHATVLLSDGTSEIVGTGCANRSSMDDGAIRKEITRADRAAKNRARMAAELVGLRIKIQNHNAAVVAVHDMAAPEITSEAHEDHTVLRMGAAKVWVHSRADNAERIETLDRSWRSDTIKSISGISMNQAHTMRCRIEDIEFRLEKIGA